MTDRKNNFRIRKTLEVSKDILKDCTLENGGIVAANSGKRYYPANAKSYYYVWPRDAAFACLASDMVLRQ